MNFRYNLFFSIQLLASSSRIFAEKCVAGIKANRERCAEMVEKSLAIVTYLVPFLGYDRAADVSKRAYESVKTILDIVREEKLLDDDELKKFLETLRGKA